MNLSEIEVPAYDGDDAPPWEPQDEAGPEDRGPRDEDGLHEGEENNEEPPSYASRLRASLVHGDAIADIPPPRPLVDGLVDLDTLAVVYGPSGGGKTLVTIDLGLSIATGTWWAGRKVESGPVLYVVAEGLSGFGIRVKAWQQRRQVWTCGDITWLPMAVSLMDLGWTAALVDVVRELQPKLVVLDTLARCMSGADENSARDIGLAVESAEAIRRACGGCVLLVHHTGKDETAGARGSSALRAAVATEIECRLADDVVTLKQTKQKDHQGGGVIRLAAVPVGESLALEPYRGGQGLPQGALDLLAELADIADDDGVSSSVWMRSSGVAERSFYRWQRGLVELDYCQKSGEKTQARYTVSDLGREVLKG